VGAILVGTKQKRRAAVSHGRTEAECRDIEIWRRECVEQSHACRN
jgi:hypothetical protein